MQTEVEAFLKRILAFPDEDAPRLIFADWLEDQSPLRHGRNRGVNSQGSEWGPERGRFIRIQIALARMQEEELRELELTGACRHRDTFHGFEVEEHDLLKNYEADWLAPFQELGQTAGAKFHRGFIEKLHVDAKDLVRHEHALFAASPLRHIRLMNIGDCLPGVFHCTCLSRLAALTIDASHIGTPLARAVAQAERLAAIKALHLPGNKFDDDSVRYLASSPNFANLDELDLGKNDLSESSAHIIAASPHFNSLRVLELGNNRLGPVGAEIVAGSERLANLRRLGLSHNEIGIARLQTLSRTNGFLKVPVLDLSENHLSAAGLHVILNRNPGPTDPAANRLRDLDLRGNPLGDDGMRVLAACRHLENLRVLRLVNCGIGDEGVRILASSPHLNNVVVLDLSKNPIGDSGCRHLQETRHFRKLRNPITPIIGISALAMKALNDRYPDRMNQSW